MGQTHFRLLALHATVALTDDTSGNAIVCPADGFIIAIITVPGLGLNGRVEWYLAEDLRNADADASLDASLYTNSDNEIIFGAGDQDGGATTGNKIIIKHTGEASDSSGGSTPVLPTILEFDVTGDNSVPTGSITGKTYNYELEISQPAHVSEARIVGFAGTAANPLNVEVLQTNTQINTDGDYTHKAGAVTIPAGVSLANAGDIYTIRLEVYPTGTSTSAAPTIYHDYRITARAAAQQSHFGHMPYYRSDGSTETDDTDLTAFTNDISTNANIAGTWTISGLTRGDGERRLYWAVPVANTQPVNWLNSGDNVNDIIEFPDATNDRRTIGGVQYLIYVTNTPFDDISNSLSYVVNTG